MFLCFQQFTNIGPFRMLWIKKQHSLIKNTKWQKSCGKLFWGIQMCMSMQVKKSKNLLPDVFGTLFSAQRWEKYVFEWNQRCIWLTPNSESYGPRGTEINGRESEGRNSTGCSRYPAWFTPEVSPYFLRKLRKFLNTLRILHVKFDCHIV